MGSHAGGQTGDQIGGSRAVIRSFSRRWLQGGPGYSPAGQASRAVCLYIAALVASVLIWPHRARASSGGISTAAAGPLVRSINEHPRPTATSRTVTPHRVNGRHRAMPISDITPGNGVGQEERAPSRRSARLRACRRSLRGACRLACSGRATGSRPPRRTCQLGLATPPLPVDVRESAADLRVRLGGTARGSRCSQLWSPRQAAR